MKWEDIVQPGEERLVFQALDEQDCTWRAADTVADDTNLSEARVVEIVKKYEGQLTRQAKTRSVTGTPLVGLIERVGPATDFSSELQAQVANRIRGILDDLSGHQNPP